MKIAQISCVFPPYKSGISNAAYNFARLAAEHKHEVTVFTPRYGQTEVLYPDFTTIRCRPLLTSGNGAFLPGLFLKLHDFDLVHLHYPFYGGAEMVWLAKSVKFRFKLIIHYHMDTDDLRPLAKFLSLPARMIENSLFNSAEAITVASFDYVKHSRIKYYFAEHRGKFQEIAFGVDTKKFFPIPHHKNTVLFVGALDTAHSFKGVDVLLSAVAKISHPFRLVIVGDGNLRDKYEKLAASMNLGEKVVFIGRIADESLAEYYRQAAITVLPSVSRHEAFGLVLLESLASGTPVIASDLPGVRRVFSDGHEGFLAKPGDSEDLRLKIESLLKDPEKLSMMGGAARRLALRQYDWSQVGDKLNSLYEKILLL